ncbi:MAG TPA: dihydrolipoamide acetyltransferase family protein [Gemmatimonadales bacterium]|nr:dihydrolipoamide acetyltransferase family protein [Gemmatimonadales bacterium]
MAEFRMPLLGADMTAGRLVTWYKQPGDAVKRGDIIAEVDTDKGAIDVEVFTSGVLEKILVQPGEKVPVGTPLAIIREGAPGEGAAPQPAAPSPAPPAAPAGPERAGRMRQAIAAAVTRSKREIPHFYLATTIDLQRATSWLAEQNATRPVADRLVVGVLFLKAVALALRQVPELNARWEGDHAVRSEAIHVGVATFLRDGGLVAPALHDTDRQSLADLMRNFRDLVNRARGGELRSSELSDPTITVTSLGDRGVEAVFGVIYPPQVAIVGFGKVVERPWSVSGRVDSRPVVTATLSADHRVSDGHRGGLFLAAVAALLQEPGRL